MSNISIRPINEQDTDKIVKWRNNKKVKKNFVYQEDFTREGHLHWLHTKVDTGEVAQFIIEAADRAVGSCYLRDISSTNKSAEFGIFIGEDDARGKGYGTMAGKLLLDYGFNSLGLHRIFLRVFEDNTAAIRSYRKIGFREEGVFKDMIYQNGRYRSMVFMACFNENEKNVSRTEP